MVGAQRKMACIFILFIFCFVSVVLGLTNPNDLRILNEFRKGLQNPELLKWPGDDDNPCGPPSWPHVICTADRVSQIQLANVGLNGTLPPDFNQLTELTNLGFQRNQFTGKLPTFKGLSKLRYAYLGYNQFDTIPSDFAQGLDVLEVLSLDDNPLNKTAGWSIPTALQNSVELMNLTLMNCGLVGAIPDFLGTMPSLSVLKLAYNNLSGEIPASFNQSDLKILWLNNQAGVGLSGPIDVIASMTFLSQLWLHGNQFTGTIPDGIGALSLSELNLNGNQLVGQIPDSLANMDSLQSLDISNNNLIGSVPKLKAGNFSYANNPLCQSIPGVKCSPQVTALLNFLRGVNYPLTLVSSWEGNDPCQGPWLGLACNSDKEVLVINLPNHMLNGTLDPSVGELESLTDIRLSQNNIRGTIPQSLSNLKSLKLMDMSRNNIEPPVPKFNSSVKLIIDGNPQLQNGNPPPNKDDPDSSSSQATDPSIDFSPQHKKSSKLILIVVPVASFVLVVLLLVPLSMYCWKKRRRNLQSPSSFVVHPRDPSDREDMVKIVVSDNTNGRISTATGSSSQSRFSTGIGDSHIIESGNLVISVQVLRKVTKNFAPQNEIGRGGFGTVYKGELDDGTKIAVKRMEAGIITNTALDEFHSEITVLSKVRHRHLVSLLGYSIEGNERLLVYEYVPQGALSRHLFQWERLKLEPLSWKRRLNIALDVARAMEYLHSLAHQSFIHRDLKSSNILLCDDYRAKVSDFGLVKLAPDGMKSMATRLAGTFGYLAPEYAVTGKISTKVDVFSFGVVLMELLTGMTALDEDRPEESQYLAAWFWNIKSNKEKLTAAIDKALEVNEEKFDSISVIAELAGHCTAREPNQRPEMGHAVNVLSSLVEMWKPFNDETEGYTGIDYSLPLTQMVKGWQEAEGTDNSYIDLDHSKGSIPARPTGFAESFTSADGR